jgi:hypothetical protein
MFLCSCTRVAPWPELVERTIIFDNDVPETYRAAVMSAAAKWNDAADSDLLLADDGKHRCHVFVFVSDDLGKPGRLGVTVPTAIGACSLIVRLKPDMDAARIAMSGEHELGHVLLEIGHSENKDSVMYRAFIRGEVTEDNPLGMSTQHITDEEVERLHARMRGHGWAPRVQANDECYEP